MISATFAGLAGVVYASHLGYIGPGMSSVAMTFRMLLFLMLAARGHWPGRWSGRSSSAWPCRRCRLSTSICSVRSWSSS